MVQANMRHWYLRRAEAAGGESTPVGGSLMTRVAEGLKPGGWKATLPFPLANSDLTQLPPVAETLWATVGEPISPPGWREALKQRGFDYGACAVTMAREAGAPTRLPKQPTLTLRDLQQVDLPQSTWHPSYGPLDQPEGQATWRAARSLASGERPTQKLLGGFLADTLVVTATLHDDGQSVGLYDIATLLEQRNQGFASWIVAQALALADATWPGRPLVLQNDVGLVPLYEGHGFSRVGFIEHWFLPPGRAQLLTSDVEVAMEALATAVVLEDLPACDALLANCPDLARAELPAGGTALHLAAFSGSAQAVRRLIDAGADPGTPDREHESTPLQWALYGLSQDGPPFKRAQAQAAQLLLAAGAAFEAEDQEDARALGEDLLQRLLGARSDPA